MASLALPRGKHLWALLATLIWAALIGGWFAYEWGLPFYEKRFFFEVLPSSDTIIGGGSRVVTPVRYGWLATSLLLPIAAIWAVTIGTGLRGPLVAEVQSHSVNHASALRSRLPWFGLFALIVGAHAWTTHSLEGGSVLLSAIPRGMGATLAGFGVAVLLLLPIRLYMRKNKTLNWWAIYAISTAVLSAFAIWSRITVAEYERTHPRRPNNALHSDAPASLRSAGIPSLAAFARRR